MNAQHLSLSDSWMTPDDVLERVRNTLGGIDLDPASSEAANERVKATTYFTEQDNGLLLSWTWFEKETSKWIKTGSVFCNPPGGKFPKGHALGGQGKTGLFWDKLMRERQAGHIKHAVFLFFSLEGLSNNQGYGSLSPTRFPVCIPKKRTRFLPPTGVKAGSPTHANAIVYVPGYLDETRKFWLEFQSLGDVMRPM